MLHPSRTIKHKSLLLGLNGSQLSTKAAPQYDIKRSSFEHVQAFSQPIANSQAKVGVAENLMSIRDTIANTGILIHDLMNEKLNEKAEMEKMVKRQLKVEEEQLVEAAQIYGENYKNLTNMGRGTTMKSVQRLLLQWYEPLIAILNKEIEEIRAGKYGTDRNVSITS